MDKSVFISHFFIFYQIVLYFTTGIRGKKKREAVNDVEVPMQKNATFFFNSEEA